MRLFIAILVNKFITFLCKLLGKNGSQYPGCIVLDYIDKNILDKVKYPDKVIAVTGSAGKGSCCRLVKHILEDNGYSVALNENGSNGIVGATTMILNNCSLSGKFKKDILLLESDERHLKLIFNKKRPDYLVVLNITRDQPTRNGSPEEVYSDILKVANDKVHLIINADDPFVSSVKLKHKGKITTYGMEKMKDDITAPLLNNVDFLYCPKCGKKLEYKFFHYGHLGSYKCKNCDYSRGQVDYVATDIDLDKQNIKVNGIDVYINRNVIYAGYASLASFTVTSVLGIKNDDIARSLNENKVSNVLEKEYSYKGRKFILLETKNENNLSYFQGCNYIAKQKGKKSVILGFERVSKRYKDTDLSWLYDINFELLNDDNIDQIMIFGRFRYDIALRLEYAGIDLKRIIFVDDTKDLVETAINNSKGDIYTMIWYDSEMLVIDTIKGGE